MCKNINKHAKLPFLLFSQYEMGVCVWTLVQVTYYISQGKSEDEFFYLNAARFLKSLTLSFQAFWITTRTHTYTIPLSHTHLHYTSLSHTLVIKLVYTVKFPPFPSRCNPTQEQYVVRTFLPSKTIYLFHSVLFFYKFSVFLNTFDSFSGQFH